MADTASKSPQAKQFSGPYETWMLNHGRFFDLPGLLLQNEAVISAVAELPQGFDPTMEGLSARHGKATYPTAIPELWRGEDGRFAPKFVPFLFRPKDEENERQLLGSEDIGHIPVDARFLPRTSILKEDGKVGEPFFRTNFPLFSDTVDETMKPWGERTDGHPKGNDDGKPLVILAVIDDGIPFAHSNFRAGGEDGTRIDYCWSQAAASCNDGVILFGREFTKLEIDNAVSDNEGDEDAIYRNAGVLSQPGRPPMPLSQMFSHGAHVLDIAAGGWPEEDDTNVRIIGVDLPSTAIWDTSGFGTDMFVLSALHYIFERADRIAAAHGKTKVPLIINFSFGTTGGPHDGTSMIEEAMQEMIATRRAYGSPTALVMPSGNVFLDGTHAVLTQVHFQGRHSDGPATAELRWELAPNDRTSSFMEMWFPYGTDPSAFSFALYNPSDELVLRRDAVLKADGGAGQPEGYFEFEELNEGPASNVFGQFSIDKYRNGRWRIMLALAPTEYAPAKHTTDAQDNNRTSAPAGTWRIVLERADDGTDMANYTRMDDVSVAGGIQCFIQRDIRYGSGDTGARQSRFVDPDNRIFNKWGALGVTDSVSPYKQAQIRRFGSLNGMATAMATLVAGGFNEYTGNAVPYSSAGALRYDTQGKVFVPGKQVTVSAVTERSPAHFGVIGAGTRSGVNFRLNGTSVATPLIARQLAKAFLQNPNLSTAIKGKLKTPHATYIDMLATITVGSQATSTWGIAGPGSDERLGKLLIREPRPWDPDDVQRVESFIERYYPRRVAPA